MPGGRWRPQIHDPRAVGRCEVLLFAGADAGIRAEAPLPRRGQDWRDSSGRMHHLVAAGLASLWEASTARLEAASSRGSETCLPGECVWAVWWVVGGVVHCMQPIWCDTAMLGILQAVIDSRACISVLPAGCPPALILDYLTDISSQKSAQLGTCAQQFEMPRQCLL